jgi:hypothetical protein
MASIKRQRAELGERKRDFFVMSKPNEKNYYLNGTKASPMQTVQQALKKSKISRANMVNYWNSEPGEFIESRGYYGVSMDLADKVKDPIFYERRRQAICYIFETMGLPEEVIWEDEGVVSGLMERLSINRNSRSSVINILRDVLKSQASESIYDPNTNSKRRGRQPRIVDSDDSAKSFI